MLSDPSENENSNTETKVTNDKTKLLCCIDIIRKLSPAKIEQSVAGNIIVLH